MKTVSAEEAFDFYFDQIAPGAGIYALSRVQANCGQELPWKLGHEWLEEAGKLG
ncbi:MAG: hypothetical protein OXN96_01540 [Bryobacterales bacterium]|nr:hypothetical protein [Bryobacterales bacterium]